jgi:antitoxin ParD1/3/4
MIRGLIMSSKERLVVDLPSDLVKAVRDAVKSGAFASESDVLGAALRIFHGDDHLSDEELEEVRALVAEALTDADAGRFVEGDAMFERLRSRH